MAYGKDEGPRSAVALRQQREARWKKQLQELEKEDVDRFDECKK